MILPLVILFLAALAAAAVAYGTQPGWTEFQHGLQLILWSRRLQWPLVTVSLLLCLALVALVISGRRRAWWLVGLGPVLLLFVQWLQTGYPRVFAVADNPEFIDTARAGGIGDGEGVVAVTFGDVDYAYPLSALARTPVLLQTDHDRRMIVLWSAAANRVLAFRAGRDLKARDLEVVSMPPTGPLLYNNRLGQFINAMKGLALDGRKAAGFGSPVPVTKTTWGQWRAANPAGKVLQGPPPAADGWAGFLRPVAAAGLMAVEPGRGAAGRPSVVVVGTTRPAAVAADSLSAAPLEMTADGVKAVVYRPVPGGAVRAFVIPVTKEGATKFEPARDPKTGAVVFKDAATGTIWNAAGVAVGGSKDERGKRLTALSVDEGVDEDHFRRAWPEVGVYREPPPVPPAGVGPTSPAREKASPPRAARGKTSARAKPKT